MINLANIIEHFAQKALRERLAYYSVAVVGNEHGTGVPIEYDGKKFIVTCAHIVEGKEQDELRFILRTKESLVYKEKDKLHEGITGKNFRCSAMEKLPIKTIHSPSSHAIDLVAIELKESVEEKGLDFFELSQGNIKTSEVGLKVVMMGFSGEIAKPFQSRASHKKGYVLFLFQETTEIVKGGASLDGFSFEHHFFMKYYGDYCPKGMSGCAIWAFEKRNPKPIWHIDPKLVGIQSSVYRTPKLLKGQKIDDLFQLLN